MEAKKLTKDYAHAKCPVCKDGKIQGVEIDKDGCWFRECAHFIEHDDETRKNKENYN